MFHDLLIPMVAVGLAELGDKTQLAVFCLASKTKNYLSLFAGVMLGFAIANGLAIISGDIITRYVPQSIIAIVAATIFIIFGILTLTKKEEEEASCDLKTPFMSGFLMILVCEMGDKTQIASGLFATRFDPLMVFIGVMAALAIVSIMAIYLGCWVTEKIDRKTISRVAGIIFLIIGLWTLVSAFA